jgi:hypothetical protein
MLPGASQSVSAYRPPSAASNPRAPLGRAPLSQSYRKPPTTKGHLRAKSQATGLQRMAIPRNTYEEHGEGEEDETTTNGMPPISLSSNITMRSSTCELRGTRSSSVPLKKSASCETIRAQSHVSAPEFVVPNRPASALSTRLPTVHEDAISFSMSKLAISCGPSPVLSSKRIVRHCQPPMTAHLAATPTKSLGSKLPQLALQTTPKTGLKLSQPSKLNGVMESSPTRRTGLSSSPTKQVFLSKESNLTVPDWEHPNGFDNRYAMMEGMMETFKSQMAGTTFDRESTKQLVEMCKERGRLL